MSELFAAVRAEDDPADGHRRLARWSRRAVSLTSAEPVASR